MAELIPFHIVADVLTKLGSSAIRRIGSTFGVAKDLAKLTKTLDTINGVLVDAEKRLDESDALKSWVKRLQDVVYDADDLLDDFETLQLQKRGGVERQVSDFFSSSNQILFRFRVSNKIRHIKKEIVEIEKEIPLLSLVQGNIPHGETAENSSWRETHSFVLSTQIVGREENQKEIINLLVSSDNQEILSTVAIVGIGGLGKTTLAQLVYNDPRLVGFFELKIWVCVSDPFEVKSLVKKILKELCDHDVERSDLNGLKNLLHGKLSQKRCLFVLDDVWNDNYEKWDRLKSLLMVVKKGSKILVTTRHSKVASIMGIDFPFVLEGLKGTQPWDLFAKIAFKEEPGKVHPKFIEIGKEIVNMCNGVPLIIKTMGTMLRLKPEESYWLSIKNNGNLLLLRDGSDDVLSVLKLSYDNLPLPLKHCFAYCTLFPKDYAMEKKLLVQMWMAQGYVQPLDERIGDQYFDELSSRSLLEVYERDTDNNIISCKMHDLIHDLALSVIGSKVLILEDDVKHISKEVRHLLIFKKLNFKFNALKVKHIRTTILSIPIHYPFEYCSIKGFSSLKGLRVLSLSGFNICKVPESLGKLNHLRYLDLSYNSFEALPNSITSLKNLQTLKLVGCENLVEFPKDTRELINLRHLENDLCEDLRHMPCGIGELSMLQSLPLFVVGYVGHGRGVGRLSELEGLNNLRGELRIEGLENVRDVVVESREAKLGGKQHIQSLTLRWGWLESWSGDDPKSVLEGLRPHSNLKQLTVEGYGGGRFPSWMMNGGLSRMLPNLTTVDLRRCSRCQTLPCFVQLPYLKSLKLYDFEKVEHMEECSSKGPFFLSLQELSLCGMPKLKELWMNRMELPTQPPPLFPCLTQLRIKDCHDLAFLELPPSPLLSYVEIRSCGYLAALELHSSPLLSSLWIEECPKMISLQIPPSPLLSQLDIESCHELGSFELHSSTLLSELNIHTCPKLTSLILPPSPHLSQLNIKNCDQLTSLELHSSPLLTIEICYCPELTCLQVSSLPCLETVELIEVREEVVLQLMLSAAASASLESVCISSIGDLMSLPHELHHHASSLQTLQIQGCSRLAILPHWIGNLTLLTDLKIGSCPQLTSLPEELGSLRILQSLSIKDCSSLIALPDCIVSLCSLKHLQIFECPRLTSLPEGMHALTTLETLEISYCPSLSERCRREKGEDWPKIAHVPYIITDGGRV